ncbi:MAG TPA: cation-translocating P-type ATPase [Clostridiales bacterium]|nr:cation-translocating P-type ATPase [Clostridiales bacterium]
MIEYINKNKNMFTASSGILTAIGFASGLFGNVEIKNMLLLAASITGGIPIMLKAFQALRLRVFSIELLVIIAIAGALFIGEYTESSVVAFLFLFGAYLEARTLEKTRSSLKELMDLAPLEAEVLREGKAVTIPVEEVEIGDRVVLRSGSKVPVDGKILVGKAYINEAAVTGESVPASKSEGDWVYSGTLVDNGYIEFEAERIGDDTTFAKIIELVEEAQESKTSAEKFLNKFARYYTPAVIILSVIVYLITRNIRLSITFLVVACPGALVIGAPVSNVAGIGNGAKHGVLIKGGEVMERLSKVNAAVFDKTGTLTRGCPEVSSIAAFNGWNENELLGLAASAETISEHHLGQAIIKEAEARGIELSPVSNGEIIKGSGISVYAGNHKLLLGNRKLIKDNSISIPEDVLKSADKKEKDGNTVVFAAVDGKIAGLFAIMDQIREDAKSALENLRRNGIKKIVMLTGDNSQTARLIASQLNIDEVYAELMPQDKVGQVKKLKKEGYVVAMAGDGINDAPSIAAADIGFAMGKSGTDVSMETADVVLMADKLSQLSHAYVLSKATIKNMKQNTYFAVAVVFILLMGVLSGNVHLASGMFIHEASVLLVILNAMRLIGYKSA